MVANKHKYIQCYQVFEIRLSTYYINILPKYVFPLFEGPDTIKLKGCCSLKSNSPTSLTLALMATVQSSEVRAEMTLGVHYLKSFLN